METIEREAKLLEAGSYPDRGIEITEDDLDLIARNTSDAPIRIEHTDTPFDGALGFLKQVYRRGRELFGRLQFTRAAWELIRAADARRLSVGLKRDKSGIVEVSLVRQPRVADAALFGGTDSCELVRFDLDLDEHPASSDEIERLRMDIRRRDAEACIDRFKRAGKLAPAAEVFARAILESDDANVIAFGGETTPLRQLFVWFLESQPKVIEFAELAPAGTGTHTEPDIYTKLGVTSERVERYRNR